MIFIRDDDMEMDESESGERPNSFSHLHPGEPSMSDNDLFDDDAKSVMVEPPSRVHSPTPTLFDSSVDDFGDNDNQSPDPLALGDDRYEQPDIDWDPKMNSPIEQETGLSAPSLDWGKILIKTSTHSPNSYEQEGNPTATDMEL